MPVEPFPHGRGRPRRLVPAAALLAGLVAVALATSSGGAVAASSGSVVSATVPASTWLDPANCASNQAGRTSFGSVLPDTKAVTTLDCSVEFGSSNETASLRVWQEDESGSAMGRPGPWVARVSGTTEDLLDVDVATASSAWVSGKNGRMLRTTDRGASWSVFTNAATGTAQWLYGAAAVDSLIAWGVGGAGAIVKTTNGGTNWASQSVGGASLLGVEALDAQTAWAVGDGGRILRTTDGGTTWTPQASGTTESLNEVHVVSADIVWVGGFDGTILRTVNGGATWTPVTPPAAGQNYRGIYAASATTAWVGDSLADVWVTTNAGAAWTRLLDRDVGTTNVHDVDVADGTTIYATGSPTGFVDRSYDSGTTWTVETTAASFNAVAAIDSLHAYAVGAGGAIYTATSVPVSDYADDGTADWDTAGSIDLFGACLRDAEFGATGGGGGWLEDVNAGADCADGDADPWNAIPATPPGAKVASIAAPDSEGGATDPVAHLRFGFRTEAGQTPGRYLAPIVFQVVAPA